MTRPDRHDPAVPGSPDAWALLPLAPDLFHILLALADREQHGYALVKEVERSTNGAVRLAPSLLYRKLKRLMDQGIITETEKRPAPELDDQRRRYYRLTDLGQRLLQADARRLVRLADSVRIRTLAESEPGGSRA